MKTCCIEYRRSIPLYVDCELTGEERRSFLAHVALCAKCEESLREAESLSRQIRAARSSIVAPEFLRDAVLQAMQQHKRKDTCEGRPVTEKTAFTSRTLRIAMAGTVLLLVAVHIPVIRQVLPRKAETMIETAVRVHRELSKGSALLDISSDSPQAVAAWFQSRVSFPFRMADSGIATNLTAKYKLTGGRLLSVKGEHVAMVVFRLPSEIATLSVGPENLMRASGGTVVESGGVTLHNRDIGSLHIVTWNTKGLGYVLTFAGNVPGSQRCSSCHGDSSSP